MRLSQIVCGFAFVMAASQVTRANGIVLPNPISLLPANTRERPTERRFTTESVSYKEPVGQRCRKPKTPYEKLLVANGTCLN